MAYSNINRDKAQVSPGDKLKKTVGAVILIMLTISAWINVWQQASILNGAKRRNQQIQDKITGLEAADKNMVKLIEDATSSAYQQEKVREDLGLGDSGDHWLAVDLEKPTTGMTEEIPDSGSKTIIRQWWGLFVK